MPDHLHALVAPLNRDASVAVFSRWFKRWFNEEYCGASVSGGTPFKQTGNGKKAVSIGCFVRMNRFLISGNT